MQQQHQTSACKRAPKGEPESGGDQGFDGGGVLPIPGYIFGYSAIDTALGQCHDDCRETVQLPEQCNAGGTYDQGDYFDGDQPSQHPY